MSRRKSSETRDKILEAAYQLFYAKGFQATTVDEVIQISGISKPTVYSYFSTKEDLCIAYLKERREREIALMQAALSKENSAEERFFGIINHLKERILDSGYRGCGFFNMVCEIPDATNPIVQEARIYIDSFRETIQGITENLKRSDPKYSHLDVERITDAYYLIICGAIMASQEYQQPWPVERAIEEVRRLIRA